MELKTLYIQIKKIETEKFLERLAIGLIKNSYKDYICFDLLSVYLYESDIKNPFALLTYRQGNLTFMSFLIKNKEVSSGKSISYRLSDLEPDYRFKEVKKYLLSGYIQGLGFQYVRIPFSGQIMEQKKISDKLNIENATLSINNKTVVKSGREVLGNGQEVEEGFHLRKGSEFSSDFNELYLLRLESPELVGFNEIHISRDIFNLSINQLAEPLFIALMTMIYPNKVLEGLERKQRAYIKSSTNNHNTKFRTKNKAITALIGNIISSE
jgi:hypothetical protein